MSTYRSNGGWMAARLAVGLGLIVASGRPARSGPAAPQPIAVDEVDPGRGSGIHVSPDGVWVVFPTPSALRAVPAGGGPSIALLEAEPGEEMAPYLVDFLDDRRFVVLADPSGAFDQRLFVADLSTATSEEVSHSILGSVFRITLPMVIPGPAEWIVYEHAGDLYRTAPDTSPTVLVDNPPGTFILNDPLVADSTGSYVLFHDVDTTVNRERLASVSLSSGETVRLDSAPAGASITRWEISPDGTTVVFRSNQDRPDAPQLYSVPIGGGLNQPIRPSPDAEADFSFRISPDSAYIVFFSDGDGDGHDDLYTAPLPAGDPVEIVNGRAGFLGRTVVFAPDGSAFVLLIDGGETGGSQLVRCDPSGQQPPTPIQGPLAEGETIHPVIRADPVSGRILYAVETGGDTTAIWSTPFDGSDPQRLTRPLQDGGTIPSLVLDRVLLTADGQFAVYLARMDPDRLTHLYASPLAGGPPSRLSPMPVPGGEVVSLAPPQAGDRIVYAGDLAERAVYQLFAAPVDLPPIGRVDIERLPPDVVLGWRDPDRRFGLKTREALSDDADPVALAPVDERFGRRLAVDPADPVEFFHLATASAYLDLHPEPDAEWPFPSASPFWGGFAVDDTGRAYLIVDGWLHALDGESGVVDWSRDGFMTAAPLAVPGGGVIAFRPDPSTGDPAIVRIDPATGDTLWSAETDASFLNAPVAGPSNQVVVVSGDGVVYSLNRVTGSVLWSTEPLASFALAPAAVAPDDGTVYAGMGDGILYALAADTGQVLWDAEMGNQFQAAPAVDADHVYAGAIFEPLSALSRSDGSLVWDAVSSPMRDIEPVVLPNGLVLASSAGFLRALDPQTGAEVWHTGIVEALAAAPVNVSQDLVAFTTPRGFVTALAPHSGALLWTSFVQAAPASPATSPDGAVFALTEDFSITRFAPAP